MAHHAYYLVAEPEDGIARATAYAAEVLGLAGRANPDIIALRHHLFSVDDARRLADMAYRAPLTGARKAIIVSATRLFHEAQNALLKVFEEPPEDTTIILVISAEGMLLPTLRSRLLPLPADAQDSAEAISAFWEASPKEREKIVAKLLDRTKSDKDEEKQAARAEAILLVEGLVRAVQGMSEGPERRQLLAELHIFLPILHERSAPLKLIFEHLLLVIPSGVRRGKI